MTDEQNMDVQSGTAGAETVEGQPTLLIVDDDRPFLQRLGRAMESRGFTVELAESVSEGLAQIHKQPPDYAVVDMRLEDGNGLDVIAVLKEIHPDTRAVVLTGYGNIATAVTAVKMGAADYLSKPADADDVYKALMAPPWIRPTPSTSL